MYMHQITLSSVSNNFTVKQMERRQGERKSVDGRHKIKGEKESHWREGEEERRRWRMEDGAH